MLPPEALANLDGMDADELHFHANRLRSIDVAPEDNLTREQLLSYTLTRARAMDARAAGHIGEALRLEGMADNTYAQLPRYARW